ncbi:MULTISPECIES: SurA N-terminal domain-containing protein [Streptomyces]|uniref:SurA N-terminal domain-containing protein n=1 Tax=Streptomyces luteosporeus TaxID=173856 RepID=A0ABP6GJP6_9ACTN
MIRRRTALVVSAAGLLAVAPLLTACGSTPHPGAAAVVGKERITVAQLQGRVDDVREAQRSAPQGAQLLAASGRLGQDTLVRLIQYRVIEKAGEDSGVEVTRREVQERRAQVERMLGGAQAVEARFLAAGIAPDGIDQELRVGLIRSKLEDALGKDRAGEVLRKTSDSLGVQVNPRYGTWDAKRGTARPAQEPWLRPAVQDEQAGPA